MSDDVPEPQYEKKSKFWLNLPPVMFDTYLDLIRAYADADTRAIYLITFAEMISTALPEDLEDYQEYQDLIKDTPLPAKDPLSKISFEDYGKWLSVFRKVMRKAAMIGGERISAAEGGNESALVFDDLEEYQ